MPYLLRRAVEMFEPEPAAALRGFLQRQEGPAGGYCNRQGADDLYYTMFGLEVAAALDCPPPAGIAAFLAAPGDGARLDFVHRVSLVRALALLRDPPRERMDGLLGPIEAYRSADGGYHHHYAAAPAGSLYGGFLGLLAYEAAGRPVPAAGRLAAAMRSLVRAAEDAVTAHQAASLVTLLHLDGTPEPGLPEALQSRCVLAGGYRAAPRAPVPDLVSTATAVYALFAAGADLPAREAGMLYVESLWNERGGFGGDATDQVADTEHTFYGLLALGCLTDGPKTGTQDD